MDFLSCNSSARLPVMGCSDLTLQNAADCGGISSSLCLSIGGSSANDPLLFAARWIWRISNKGMCCSLRVYDLQFLFNSRLPQLPGQKVRCGPVDECCVCVFLRMYSTLFYFLVQTYYCCNFALWKEVLKQQKRQNQLLQTVCFSL